MIITIDDGGETTKLTIQQNDKVVLKKKFKSIKSALKFIYSGTKRDNVKKSIIELQQTYVFMVDSKTTVTIKGD
ncbi:hypothetical protein OAE88_00530 [bacterium]|nr:hypothetical protein [bacterium]